MQNRATLLSINSACSQKCASIFSNFNCRAKRLLYAIERDSDFFVTYDGNIVLNLFTAIKCYFKHNYLLR